jgi:hypothetical protein
MDKIKKFEYSSILGWSVSRYETFNTCKRQYYYNYYAKYDKEYSREKIDKLKKMTSIPLEIGTIVHDVNKMLLERLQQSGTEINNEKFFAFTRRKTDDYCDRKVFSELYYNKIDQLKVDEIYTSVELCLQNLLSSDRFKWIFEEAIRYKAAWIVEPPGFGETRIQGLKAYCKVDFLFPLGKMIYIMDWKTGKQDQEKHHKQLVGYATWATYHFGQEPEKITPILAYLNPEYQEVVVKVDELDVQQFSSLVKHETEEMYRFCLDVEANLPQEKEKFEKTTHTKICEHCNYRELCF